jgi:hypothetical protein
MTREKMCSRRHNFPGVVGVPMEPVDESQREGKTRGSYPSTNMSVAGGISRTGLERRLVEWYTYSALRVEAQQTPVRNCASKLDCTTTLPKNYDGRQCIMTHQFSSKFS